MPTNFRLGLRVGHTRRRARQEPELQWRCSYQPDHVALTCEPLCQSSPAITEASARLGTHLHVRRRRGGPNAGVSGQGGVSEEVPFPSSSLMRRLARTPAPKRFAIPSDGARAGGQAPLEMSAADDARPRAICPPPNRPPPPPVFLFLTKRV